MMKREYCQREEECEARSTPNFRLPDTKSSSFDNRVCYDAENQYMVILLKDTYDHYCWIPKSTVDALLAADSHGRYYNANIKSTGKDGPYDCRTHKVPAY